MISPVLDWLTPEGDVVNSKSLIDYLSFHVKSGLKLYVGTDSMLTSQYCKFSTIVAIHSNDLNIANYFLQKEKKTDQKFKNLETKILEEVQLSISAANYFKKMIPNAIIEIHMDIGEEERNETRHLVENSKGWVTGSGFISKIKPYAWASSVADWHTK